MVSPKTGERNFYHHVMETGKKPSTKRESAGLVIIKWRSFSLFSSFVHMIVSI